MRERLTFCCKGQNLAATLDRAPGRTGLLIVSGGNEIRIGPHRGMAQLATIIAAAGYPVFRFDRRGIGDSEGENQGFTESGPDLAAAVDAFRNQCPQIDRIVAYGNCDAASALLLHQPPVDGLVLSNIWVIEGESDLPPPAAIKARYMEKLKDPRQWLRLFTGAVNLRKLAAGLLRMAKPVPASSLADSLALGLISFDGPVTILLASRDNTALAFADAWERPRYAEVRRKANICIKGFESASHSFASTKDKAVLTETILSALR